jgi:hypothetical protein
VEKDICDVSDDGPKNCPCDDEFCPNKPGGDGYFKFLYPPPEKMKFDDDGCAKEQQVECWVLPNGQVSVAVNSMIRGTRLKNIITN